MAGYQTFLDPIVQVLSKYQDRAASLAEQQMLRRQQLADRKEELGINEAAAERERAFRASESAAQRAFLSQESAEGREHDKIMERLRQNAPIIQAQIQNYNAGTERTLLDNDLKRLDVQLAKKTYPLAEQAKVREFQNLIKRGVNEGVSLDLYYEYYKPENRKILIDSVPDVAKGTMTGLLESGDLPGALAFAGRMAQTGMETASREFIAAEGNAAQLKAEDRRLVTQRLDGLRAQYYSIKSLASAAQKEYYDTLANRFPGDDRNKQEEFSAAMLELRQLGWKPGDKKPTGLRDLRGFDEAYEKAVETPQAWELFNAMEDAKSEQYNLDQTIRTFNSALELQVQDILKRTEQKFNGNGGGSNIVHPEITDPSARELLGLAPIDSVSSNVDSVSNDDRSKTFGVQRQSFLQPAMEIGRKYFGNQQDTTIQNNVVQPDSNISVGEMESNFLKGVNIPQWANPQIIGGSDSAFKQVVFEPIKAAVLDTVGSLSPNKITKRAIADSIKEAIIDSNLKIVHKKEMEAIDSLVMKSDSLAGALDSLERYLQKLSSEIDDDLSRNNYIPNRSQQSGWSVVNRK